MARSAASEDGRYSEAEVLDVVRADVAWQPDTRVEVYDRNGNLTDIEPVVRECAVGFDAARLIHHSLTVTLEPIPDLRDALWQYELSPVTRMGPMRRDGGYAEHRWGFYPWTRPVGATTGLAATNVEDWSLVLGDRDVISNIEGPGLRGFVASQGWEVTTAVIAMHHRQGERDYSRIQTSDVALSESLNWTLHGGPRAERRLTNREFAQARSAWQATLRELERARKRGALVVASDPEEPTRVVVRQLEDQGIRWLDVAETLYGLIGYSPPHRSLSAGAPIAEPSPDPANDTPVIIYSDTDGTLIPPVEVRPDFTDIANVIVLSGRSNANVNPGVVFAVADLAKLLPNHPLASTRSGVEKIDTINPTQPLSQDAAEAQVRRELFSSLLGFETVTYETPLNPQHEGFDLCGVRYAGHPDFADGTSLIEASWTADLIKGKMRHAGARSFAPISAEAVFGS